MKVALTCKRCRTPYEKYPSQASRSRYCSRLCSNQAALASANIALAAAVKQRRPLINQSTDSTDRFIALSNGAVAIVDLIDFDFVAQFTWSLGGSGYAQQSSRYLHRLIASRAIGRELTGEEVVDHIDGNTLNNRRFNIRVVDRLSNNLWRQKGPRGRSGYRGVHATSKQVIPWAAHIQLHGEVIKLGLFEDPEQAALAYDVAAVQLFGEFARTNIL